MAEGDNPVGTYQQWINGSLMTFSQPAGQQAVIAQATNAAQRDLTPEEKRALDGASSATYAQYLNAEDQKKQISGAASARVLSNGVVVDANGEAVGVGPTYITTPRGIVVIPAAANAIEQAYQNILYFGSAAPGNQTSMDGQLRVTEQNLAAANAFLGDRATPNTERLSIPFGGRGSSPASDEWAKTVNAFPTLSAQQAFIQRNEDPLARIQYYTRFGNEAPVTMETIGQGLQGRDDFVDPTTLGNARTNEITEDFVQKGYDPISARVAALDLQYQDAVRTPGLTDDRFFDNERQRAAQLGVSLSSEAHFQMAKGWTPYAGNPFEASGDTFLEMLKGYPTKGAEGPLSFTTPLPTYQGKPSGMQEISWEQAIQTDKGQRVNPFTGNFQAAIDLAAARMGQIYPGIGVDSPLGRFAIIENAPYRAGMSYAENGRIRIEPTALSAPGADTFYIDTPGMFKPVSVMQAQQQMNLSDIPAGLPAPFTSVGKSPVVQEIEGSRGFDPLGTTGGFVRSMFQIGPVNVADAVSNPVISTMFPQFKGIAFWAGMPGAKPQSSPQQAQFKALDTLGAEYTARTQEASRLEDMAANFPRDASGKILYDPTIPAQADWAQKYTAAAQAQNAAFNTFKIQQDTLESQGAIRNTGEGKYEITSPFADGYQFGEFSRWSEGAGKQLQAFFKLNPAELAKQADQTEVGRMTRTGDWMPLFEKETPINNIMEYAIPIAQAKVLQNPGEQITAFGQGALLAGAFAPGPVAAAVAGTARAPAGAGTSALARYMLPGSFVALTGYEATGGLTDFSPKGVIGQSAKMAPNFGAMFAGGAAVTIAPRGANAVRGVFDKSAATLQRTFSEKPSAMFQTVSERNIFVQENPLAVSGRALRVEEVRTEQLMMRKDWLPNFINPKPTGQPTVTRATTVVDIESYGAVRLAGTPPHFGSLVAREYEITTASVGKPTFTGNLKANYNIELLKTGRSVARQYGLTGGVSEFVTMEKATPVVGERFTYGGVFEERVDQPLSFFKPYKIRQSAAGTIEEGVSMGNVFQRGTIFEQQGNIIGTQRVIPVNDIARFVLSAERTTITPKGSNNPFSVSEQSVSRTFLEDPFQKFGGVRGKSGYELDFGRFIQRTTREGQGVISDFDNPLLGGTTKELRKMLGTTLGKKGEFSIGEGQRSVQNIMDRIVISRDMESVISPNRPAPGYKPLMGKKGMAPSNPFKTPLDETFNRDYTKKPPLIRPAGPPKALQASPETVNVQRANIKSPFTQQSQGVPALERFNPFQNNRFSLAEETMIISPVAAAMIAGQTGMNRQRISEPLAIAPITMSAARQSQRTSPAMMTLPSIFQEQFRPVQSEIFQGTRQRRLPDQLRGIASDMGVIQTPRQFQPQAQRQGIDQRFQQDLITQNPIQQIPLRRVPPPVEPTKFTPFGGLPLPGVPGGSGGGGGGYRGRESWTKTNAVSALMLTRNAGNFKQFRLKMPKLKLPRF